MPQADIGLIGLAVMGQNLALNISDHNISVAVYNRSIDKLDGFLNSSGKSTNITGCYSLEALASSLKLPRCIMLMVRAGEAVDATIDALLTYLEPGDIIIDGGNSHFPDTNRRYEALKQKQIRYIGAGISGGEEGARFGPSIMPGGDVEAWPYVKNIFQSIAAKVDNQPCCDWVGPAGAGHYVKMVHNGIEYADMQLIAEAYDLLHRGLGLNAEELHQVFSDWNKGVLESYLIDITANIFTVMDADGSPLLSKILDTAGQKGTGKWAAINALENGSPLTVITAAVFARTLSARKQQRVIADNIYAKNIRKITADRDRVITAIHDALYAAKIISYAQGFMLIHQAATELEWPLNYGSIALMWRGGCIIRSRFLDNIKEAYDKNPTLENLLLDSFFKEHIIKSMDGWRATLKMAIDAGVPTAAMSSALAFFDGYCSSNLPANLIQAQRDYFGAHTYERVDKQPGVRFHTDWVGLQGSAISGVYDV
ncbi:MAG: decarboxylating NADP(+)-dependent phosphogluconate dehydrogenase [Pseudomonadales bacterium]